MSLKGRPEPSHATDHADLHLFPLQADACRMGSSNMLSCSSCRSLQAHAVSAPCWQLAASDLEALRPQQLRLWRLLADQQALGLLGRCR